MCVCVCFWDGFLSKVYRGYGYGCAWWCVFSVFAKKRLLSKCWSFKASVWNDDWGYPLEYLQSTQTHTHTCKKVSFTTEYTHQIHDKIPWQINLIGKTISVERFNSNKENSNIIHIFFWILNSQHHLNRECCINMK